MANGHRGGEGPRTPVSVDFSEVLKWMLFGSFGVIAASIIYGFATGTLSPTVALATGATLFSGILTGMLAGPRSTGKNPPDAEPDGET